MKYEKKIYFGVLIWLLFGDWVSAFVRMMPFVARSPFLYSAAGILPLSDMLGTAIGAVSDLMFNFWELIPILR
jgi:hypothetical protein